MRAIKAIVIFMGLLLIAGLGLLGYGLYSKASNLSKTPAERTADAPAAVPAIPAAAVPEAASGAAAPVFGSQTVALPPGSRVEAMASAANRIVLHVAGPQGSRLVVVDPVSGAVTGTLVLTPEATPGAAQQGGGAAQ